MDVQSNVSVHDEDIRIQIIIKTKKMTYNVYFHIEQHEFDLEKFLNGKLKFTNESSDSFTNLSIKPNGDYYFYLMVDQGSTIFEYQIPHDNNQMLELIKKLKSVCYKK